MFTQMSRNFLNKSVQLFPSDTYRKYGTITDINPAGITIEITVSDSSHYPVGSVHFIAFCNNLTFKLIEE